MEPNRAHSTPPHGNRSLSRLPSVECAGDASERSTFSSPGEEEATCFYYGFPSQPRLVGRTSITTEPWESIDDQLERHFAEQRAGRRSGSTHFTPRSLTPGPIGFHAIQQIWGVEMHLKLAATLHPLPWRSIDVLRMAAVDCDTEYVTMYSGTVVVWVGLEHANTPWKVVSEVLVHCRCVLDAAGLRDVDIQLRTSQNDTPAEQHPTSVAGPSSQFSHVSSSTPLASPPDNFIMSQMGDVFPFTSAIGQPIFPFKAPTMQGSLGLFCWPETGNRSSGSKPEAIYAITCRHVGMADQPNTYFNVTARPPSQKRGDSARTKLGSNQQAIGIATQKTTDGFLGGINYRLRQLTLDLGDDSSGWEALSRDGLSMLSKMAESLADFRNADARKIGRVVYSPPIGATSEPETARLWTRDLCLVKIENEKVPRGTKNLPWPANIVDLRVLGVQHGKLESLLNSFPMDDSITRRPIRYRNPDLSPFFKLSGVIPIEEIMNPSGSALGRDQNNRIVVGKSGPETGVTWGWASELMSLRRTPLNDRTPGSISLEWAIYGMGKDGPRAKSQPFSAPGDSGSAVFGIDGRLGGFVTSGDDTDSSITYATPAVYVLGDIESALGTKVCF